MILLSTDPELRVRNFANWLCEVAFRLRDSYEIFQIYV